MNTKNNRGSDTDGIFDDIKQLLYFLRCDNDIVVMFNKKRDAAF